MKKLSVLVFFVLSLTVRSQTAFEEDGHYISIGYGAPNLQRGVLKRNREVWADMLNYDKGIYKLTTFGTGPLFLKYEHAVRKKLGIGLVLGYASTGVKEIYTRDQGLYDQQSGYIGVSSVTDVTITEYKTLFAGVRFNYHFGNYPKFDPYLGMATGYNHVTKDASFSTSDPRYNSYVNVIETPWPVYLGLTFGMRYYPKNNFGLTLELGLDKWAILQAGFAFKFK